MGFWGLRDVQWDYGRFLMQLSTPLVLYLTATTLVTSSPQMIEDWRAHFHAVRHRFFGLHMAFGFLSVLSSIVAVGPEVGWPPPLYALSTLIWIVALSTIGMLANSDRVQLGVAVAAILANVAFIGINDPPPNLLG